MTRRKITLLYKHFQEKVEFRFSAENATTQRKLERAGTRLNLRKRNAL